jgi:SAM-dependent methyltransferase
MSESAKRDPTKRFSDRVQDYINSRPTYPQAVIDLLESECGLTPASTIADVGAGTGILTTLFARNGNEVFAIEPNAAMREACEILLREYPNVHVSDGRAEATGLSGKSADIVAAGQAFHWFEPVETRAEFERILRPRGWCVLIWNVRERASTPFLTDYESLLLRYGIDYREVSEQHANAESLATFFGGGYRTARFPNHQQADAAGARGRLLSSSYMPTAGHPDFEPMLASLDDVFLRHARDGRVTFEYLTTVCYGQLGQPNS